MEAPVFRVINCRIVELDQQLLLIITDPAEARATDTELMIEGCAQVTLDWQEYGNLRPHVDNHGSGLVRFVAADAAQEAGPRTGG